MNEIRRFFQYSIISFKNSYGCISPQVYVLTKIINPIFQVVFFALLASHAYHSSDITPWLIGNSFILCVYSSFFGVGTTLILERNSGTLKFIITSPASKFKVLFGKSFIYIFDAIITIFIGFTVSYLFLGLRLPLTNLPYLFICIICAMFTACCMGVFIGSIGLVTRDINQILNVCSMILMALSGVNYPIEQLPLILQKISNIIPLTNALKSARMLTLSQYNGINMNVFYANLINEAIIGILYLAISVFSIKIMEKIARKNASIDLF